MFVGILGGGQLGRMLALAGHSLGVRCRVLDPAQDCPAGQVAEQIVGAYDDPDALEHFADGLDVATYEFEHLPLGAIHSVAERVAVFPPVHAIEVVRDRLTQKTFLQSLGTPIARFIEINTQPDLEEAVTHLGLPAVLKTRYRGYDGKGQCMLHKSEDLELAWNALGERPLMLEVLVPFQRELSLIAVSDRGGHVAFYPLVENYHQHHILQRSIAPAPDCTDQQQLEAEQVVLKIVHALRYVGVLTVEFFQHEGRLIVNELAPRVHNSGHWTIEGAETSQFENHLRAILGLPVGATAMRGCAAMFNLIGNLEHAEEWLAVPGAHLHLYGKAARPGRKLGHVTIRADDPDTLNAILEDLGRHPPTPI